MRCPPRRQQLLQVLGDLGVAKAWQAPVDTAHVYRCRGSIALNAHQRQAEAVGALRPVFTSMKNRLPSASMDSMS